MADDFIHDRAQAVGEGRDLRRPNSRHRVLDGAVGGREPLAGAVVEPEPLAAPGLPADFHSGIFFSSSSVLAILKPPLPASQRNWSIGNATSWAPTPSTPPAPTTRRSTMVLLSGFISTVETLPIFLSSLP